jgi:hypothetical protein
MCLWLTLKTTNRGGLRSALALKLTCLACFLSLICLVTQFRPRESEFTSFVSNIDTTRHCDSNLLHCSYLSTRKRSSLLLKSDLALTYSSLHLHFRLDLITTHYRRNGRALHPCIGLTSHQDPFARQHHHRIPILVSSEAQSTLQQTADRRRIIRSRSFVTRLGLRSRFDVVI